MFLSISLQRLFCFVLNANTFHLDGLLNHLRAWVLLSRWSLNRFPRNKIENPWSQPEKRFCDLPAIVKPERLRADCPCCALMRLRARCDSSESKRICKHLLHESPAGGRERECCTFYNTQKYLLTSVASLSFSRSDPWGQQHITTCPSLPANSCLKSPVEHSVNSEEPSLMVHVLRCPRGSCLLHILSDLTWLPLINLGWESYIWSTCETWGLWLVERSNLPVVFAILKAGTVLWLYVKCGGDQWVMC